VSELLGTHARLITRSALEADKSAPREEGQVNSKDVADAAALGRRT
jgi:hypothetical protein